MAVVSESILMIPLIIQVSYNSFKADPLLIRSLVHGADIRLETVLRTSASTTDFFVGTFNNSVQRGSATKYYFRSLINSLPFLWLYRFALSNLCSPYHATY